MQIKVDITNLDDYAKKMQSLSSRILPKVILETLNGVALHMKKDTLIESSNKAFVNREKNFFKSNSKVAFAKGFDISQMVATVGFVDNGSQAVQDLEQQEDGGTIKGRKYIPVNNARTGKTTNRKVAARNRLSKIGIGNIVNSKNANGVNDKQKFVKSVIHAGKGGFVQSELNGKKMVWLVNSLNKTKAGKFKLTALYIVNDSKTVKINKATHFAEKAAIKAEKQANTIYKKEAETRIKRHLSK